MIMPTKADYLGTLIANAPETAAQQIAEHNRPAILAGLLPPGSLLLSRLRLSEHYGAARETVKAALAQRRREGLIQRDWLGSSCPRSCLTLLSLVRGVQRSTSSPRTVRS